MRQVATSYTIPRPLFYGSHLGAMTGGRRTLRSLREHMIMLIDVKAFFDDALQVREAFSFDTLTRQFLWHHEHRLRQSLRIVAAAWRFRDQPRISEYGNECFMSAMMILCERRRTTEKSGWQESKQRDIKGRKETVGKFRSAVPVRPPCSWLLRKVEDSQLGAFKPLHQCQFYS